MSAAPISRVGLRKPLLAADACPHDALEPRPAMQQRVTRCNDCGELVVAPDVARMRALAKQLEAQQAELAMLRGIAEGTSQMLLAEHDDDELARDLAHAQTVEALKRWRRGDFSAR